jgi:hypothetical protein
VEVVVEEVEEALSPMTVEEEEGEEEEEEGEVLLLAVEEEEVAVAVAEHHLEADLSSFQPQGQQLELMGR